jgi:hypothetical protein
VVLTNGAFLRNSYPAYLDDGTPLPLTGPYERRVVPVRPIRGSHVHDANFARYAARKAWILWRERVNTFIALEDGSADTGFWISVMVFGKGIIPEGEEEFPAEFEGLPVEVLDGRFNAL